MPSEHPRQGSKWLISQLQGMLTGHATKPARVADHNLSDHGFCAAIMAIGNETPGSCRYEDL